MDDAAFEALYRTHGAEVWRFARRRASSAADADDATAEAFAVAWRRRHDLPAPPDDRLWLLGTIRRVMANHHRGDRRRTQLADRIARSDGTAGRGDDDPADTVDDAALLWSALAAIPEDQRELLLLRAWDRLPVTDIAALLACTPNAASIRLTRARDRLAAELAAKGSPRVRTSAGHDPDHGRSIP